MIDIQQTDEFSTWLSGLRDPIARAHISKRIQRLRNGNPGNAKRLTDAVSELKVDHGPGYRVYFTQRGPVIVILLCGGDKSTQTKDVKRAAKLASEIGD